METVIENEIDDMEILQTLSDGSELLQVGITGDAGGNSMKHTFSLLNHKNGKLKQHVLMVYEAADTLKIFNKC